jgi:hypothetical protein
MKIDYAKTSPYGATPQTSWHIGRYVHRSIPAHKNDTLFELKPRHQYRPDLLSQELYGSPVYWWVFVVCNTKIIRDPIWDFKTGTTIVVPSADYIKTIIG